MPKNKELSVLALSVGVDLYDVTSVWLVL